MEPKSGKLHKHSYGLFGPRWTEKWVHLDGRVLKYFSMAADAKTFSLSSSRQSSVIELHDYAFQLSDDKKLNRKFTFQFVAKEKSLKTIVFACASERELNEWKLAFQTRAQSMKLRTQSVTPAVAEKLRRPEETSVIVTSKEAAYETLARRQSEHHTSSNQRTLGIVCNDAAAAVRTAPRPIAPSRVLSAAAVAGLIPTTTDVAAKAHVHRFETEDAGTFDAVPLHAEQAAVAALDWSSEYASLLLAQHQSANASIDSPNTIAARAIALAAFWRRFCEASEQLARQIIHDLVLPVNARQLVELPHGAADAFVLDATECRVASMDLWKGSSSNVQMFGANGLLVYVVYAESAVAAQRGDRSSNSSNINSDDALQAALAHKRIGHQLRAARALHDVLQRLDDSNAVDSASARHVRLPLQSIVDYLGFRCFVVAANTRTLPPGAAAATATTKQACTEQLAHAYEALGLMTDSLAATSRLESASKHALHFLPASVQLVAMDVSSSPSTYELHGVHDVFPADASTSASPDDSLQHVLAAAGCKFRPEFVQLYGTMLPLHSNAHHAAQQLADDASKVYNASHQRALLEAQLLKQAAISASALLECDVAPAFVRALEDGSIDAVDSVALTTAMHARGLNARYLGLCFVLATAPHVRRLLLCEMIARVCKHELRAALRSVLIELAATFAAQSTLDATRRDDALNPAHKHSSASTSLDVESLRLFAHALVHLQAREVVVAFFNLVLGMSAPESRVFWRDRILPHVRLKFGLDSSSDRSGFGASLQSHDALLHDVGVHPPQLFHTLQTHTGYAFAARMDYNFRSAQPLVLDDLVLPLDATTSTRLLARTSAQCEDALANVSALVASGQFEDALARLKLHIAILDTSPRDERALPLTQLLAQAASLCLQTNQLHDATAFAALAVESSAASHVQCVIAHTVSMQVQHALGNAAAVRTHYSHAVEAAQWHLGDAHPCLLTTHMAMVESLRSSSSSDYLNEVTQIALSCVATARECFGRMSLVYAGLRRQQGLLLAECASHADEAVGVLEDAAAVYERHVCASDALATTDNSSTIVAMACTQHAADCYYAVAAILSGQQQQYMDSAGSPRSDLEKAYAAARRALSLRTDVLPHDHDDVVCSLLQLGALANNLGDHFRALENLRPALAGLQQRCRSATINDSEDTTAARIATIQFVTQTVLQLQLTALSSERASVVERTRTRFAALLATLRTDASEPLQPTAPNKHDNATPHEHHDAATQLLAYVVAKLLHEDASAYFDALVDRTRDELQAHRTQQFTTTLSSPRRHASVEAPSSPIGSARLHSPSSPLGASRFASFSPGTSSRNSYVSPPHSPLVSPRSPTMMTSTVRSDQQLDASLRPFDSSAAVILTTPSGEFTYGAQLAAVLTLVE